jgi:signal transduction histidine kinase
MRIESAISSIAMGESAAGQGILADVVSIIQGAMDEVRRISLGLRPPMIDDLGIIATIGWFCREFSLNGGGLRVELDLRVEERDIPEHLKIVIYRVLQEAMNNIVEHADAHIARVRLLRASHNLELIIEDDGCGFDVNQTGARSGNLRGSGLTNMRGRIESVDGSLSVERNKGAGTIVRANFPRKPRSLRSGQIEPRT